MKTIEVTPEEAALLDEVFGNVPSLKDSDLEELSKAVRALEDDPEFVADSLKGRFVSEIYHAMDEEGINANQLAQRWGKSRQYLSKILSEDRRINFTIDTMVDLMMQLDRRVELHFPRRGEHTAVIRCVRESAKSAWDTPTTRTPTESVANFRPTRQQSTPQITLYEHDSAA